MAATTETRTDRSETELLSSEQREAILAAKAWWQEGERSLDYLAERARNEARIARIQSLLADLRTRREAAPDLLADVLRLARALSANRALNRGRETESFGAALRDLLFGERPLPARLSGFLQTQPLGTQTASQLLYAAFPDRFPLVSPATRAVLAPSRTQKNAARHIARERYQTPTGIRGDVLALLADFVLYDAMRSVLGLDTFLEVNAVLWHAREMPAGTRTPSERTPSETARGVARETSGGYAAPAGGTRSGGTRSGGTERELLALVEGHVAAQGFTFPELAVRDYYIALKTKPFVILAGLSGTGKTRLTELFADALTGSTATQYRLLPVRPDWTDATALLGFYNLLAGEYVSTPFLDLLLEAGRAENQAYAYFICLDEMNLARVEHYFADVLSAMETRARAIALQGARTVRIPENLFITGSVNVDEATHPFSKKVLDRANTLEFTEVRFGTYAGGPPGRTGRAAAPDIGPRERQRLFLGSRAAGVGEAQERLAALKPSYPDRILSALSSLNELLATRGMHFGYRVRDEVLIYVANAFEAGDDQGLLADPADTNLAIALDLQILQKALPRLSGTQEALEGLLADVEAWAGDAYPRTRAKVARMRRRAAEEGIVTFYEP